ncbi:MAG TPA: response regulator [Puia sp.]|nr:response regulator [Puia sp.]
MSKRIYLIDDDPIFVFLIRKVIEAIDAAAGIEVFPDGELAISRIAGLLDEPALMPDLIFLDLNMPVLDGWGFLDQYSEIRGGFPKTVVLYIISSTITPAEIERAGEFPFISGLIIKPPDKGRIEEILTGSATR